MVACSLVRLLCLAAWHPGLGSLPNANAGIDLGSVVSECLRETFLGLGGKTEKKLETVNLRERLEELGLAKLFPTQACMHTQCPLVFGAVLLPPCRLLQAWPVEMAVRDLKTRMKANKRNGSEDNAFIDVDLKK